MILSAWGLSTVNSVCFAFASFFSGNFPFARSSGCPPSTPGPTLRVNRIWTKGCASSSSSKQTNSCQSCAVWWPSTFQCQSCPVFILGKVLAKYWKGILLLDYNMDWDNQHRWNWFHFAQSMVGDSETPEGPCTPSGNCSFGKSPVEHSHPGGQECK